MMFELERKCHFRESGKSLSSGTWFFRAFVAVILVMPFANGCAGCGDVSLKGGVYACVPDEENTCPAGWYCRQNVQGEYRCFTTPEDDDGSVVVDAASDGSVHDGSEVDAACVCTEGDCCDGCYYRGTDHRCDETPVGTALKCEELQCGTRILEAVSYKYCSGTSAQCDESNIQEGSSEVESCTPEQACREDSSGNAWCEDCGDLNCHFNNCCVDPDETEIPANCIDENCDGSDALGDTTVNLSMQISPNPVGTGSSVSVTVGATHGFAFIGLLIQDPHGVERIVQDPEITSGGGQYTWTWSSIPFHGPGKHKIIFAYDFLPEHAPTSWTPLICRILEVN